jgi:hypothetical protein
MELNCTRYAETIRTSLAVHCTLQSAGVWLLADNCITPVKTNNNEAGLEKHLLMAAVIDDSKDLVFMIAYFGLMKSFQ